MPKEAKILLSVGLLVVIGAIALVVAKPATTKSELPIDASLLIHPDSHTLGAADAKVKIVEFGDYQCPACGYAHPIVKQILKDYSANPNVSFTFRNYPLPMHQNARVSAQAAEAAAAQGKFWEMHDMLYDKQEEWGESNSALQYFTTYATAIGLDVAKFTKDVEGNKYTSVINADVKDGDDVNVNSTPTFFINGKKFGNGVSEYAAFKAEIDRLLAE